MAVFVMVDGKKILKSEWEKQQAAKADKPKPKPAKEVNENG